MLDHFGNDVFDRVHDEYVKFPLLGPWNAVERTTGKSADKIYRAMVQELESEDTPPPGVDEGHVVAPARIGDYFLPVVTSSGWYLYRTTLDDAPAIVEFNSSSSRERRLISTPLTDSASLTASADGKKIAFATYNITQGKSGQIVASDLLEFDPRTGAVQQITVGCHAWQPRLTPDGSHLLAVSAIGPHTRLVEVDQHDGSLKLLFSIRGGIVSTPSISPDGLRVAFEVSVAGVKSIRILPLSSRESAISPDDPLTDFNVDLATLVVGPTRASAYYPSFADNKTLLFSSDVSGTLALYSMAIDGKQCSIVCEDPVGAWAGEVVGDNVLYATYRTTGYTFMIKKPEQRLANPPKAASPSKENEALSGGSSQAPRAPSVPYDDLPRFLAWAPIPFYYSTIASHEILAAPGAVAWGVSSLQTSSYLASVSFRTDALQPAIELSVQTALGTVGMAYTLSEGYTNLSSTDHRQELNQQLSLSFPVISSTLFSTATSLTVSSAVSDSLSAARASSVFFPRWPGAGTDHL